MGEPRVDAPRAVDQLAWWVQHGEEQRLEIERLRRILDAINECCDHSWLIEQFDGERRMKIGDRVTLAEDLGVAGTIVRVDPNGWVMVQWDEWYGHPDQVQLIDGSPCPHSDWAWVSDGVFQCLGCGLRKGEQIGAQIGEDPLPSSGGGSSS